MFFSPLRVWVFVFVPLLWRWWRGSLQPVGFPIGAVPFQVCSRCFIAWSLPYSVVLRNIDVLSSLFLSKICESLRGGLEIFSRSHRSSLPVIIIGYHVFVQVLLVPGSGVGDVDRREVVQVSAKFLSIHDLSFRLSAIWAQWICDPSFLLLCGHLVLSNGLLVPLSFSMSFTSWVIHSCKVTRNFNSLKIWLRFAVMCSSSGRRHMPSKQKTWSLRYMLQARLALNGSGYHATGNKFERFRGFLELIGRFEFEFRRCGNYIFWTIRIFGAFMWMCRGLVVPTQFHFECCGFRESWSHMYIHIYIYVRCK